MKKLLSALAAMMMAGSFAVPLNAAPIVVPNPGPAHATDVEQIKHRGHGNGYAHGHYKHRRYAYRDCRYYGSCYRPRYYGGYPRHYGYPRYGYRDYYPTTRSGVGVYFNF